MQFTKLFNSILDSTIWQEPPSTKLVWITMLAMSDRNGEVHASIPGLAKRAGVTLQECESALVCLRSPDKYSRTQEHEGRRISDIDGGFRLLNHGKYRALLSAEERREYNRKKQAEYRCLKRENVNDMSMTVNDNKQNAHSTEAEAEADTEASKNTPLPPKGGVESGYSDAVMAIWNAYPAKGRERSTRKKVDAAWRKIKAPLADVLIAIEIWAKSDQWRKEDGQYVPALHRWLGDRGYEDMPATYINPDKRQPTLRDLRGF